MGRLPILGTILPTVTAVITGGFGFATLRDGLAGGQLCTRSTQYSGITNLLLAGTLLWVAALGYQLSKTRPSRQDPQRGGGAPPSLSGRNWTGS